MARLALFALTVALVCAVSFELTSAQAFSYRVVVYLSDSSKFDKEVKGKLKITFRNGGNSFKYALSPE